MNDAQTWTLIGGFLAILVAMSGLVLRIVQVQIEGLRNEMQAGFAAINGRLDRLETRLDRLETIVVRDHGERIARLEERAS